MSDETDILKHIQTCKHELELKESEYNFHDEQKCRIKAEIYTIQEKIRDLCRCLVQDLSHNFNTNHKHYSEIHELDVKTTSYYDHDWFKVTYGKRDNYDSYGRPYEYEGPDTMMYVVCYKCELSFTKAYKKKFEETDKDIVEAGHELFRNGILKIKRLEFENKFLNS